MAQADYLVECLVAGRVHMASEVRHHYINL
jgi:hypothetical protein